MIAVFYIKLQSFALHFLCFEVVEIGCAVESVELKQWLKKNVLCQLLELRQQKFTVLQKFRNGTVAEKRQKSQCQHFYASTESTQLRGVSPGRSQLGRRQLRGRRKTQLDSRSYVGSRKSVRSFLDCINSSKK